MYLKLNYILTLWIRFNKILIHCTNCRLVFFFKQEWQTFFYSFYFLFFFIQTMSRILYENLINTTFWILLSYLQKYFWNYSNKYLQSHKYCTLIRNFIYKNFWPSNRGIHRNRLRLRWIHLHLYSFVFCQ